MSDDLTNDILIKAAEDVTQGMWCQAEWLSWEHWNAPAKYIEEGRQMTSVASVIQIFALVHNGQLQLEDIAKAHRCAEGSLAYATLLLGGTRKDYMKAVNQVENVLAEHCSDLDGEYHSLNSHNDSCLPYNRVLESGQSLARLFREAAGVEEA